MSIVCRGHRYPPKPGDDTLIDFPFYALNKEKVDLLDPSPLDSVADVVSAQQSDPFCCRYRDILLTGNQRLIMRRARNFILVDDTLYWIDRTDGKNRYLLVVPTDLISVILESCHDKFGHFGVYKTYSTIRLRFFWKDMFRLVKKYVISCVECQRRKVGPHKSTGLYMPIPVATRVFETFSIDLLGPVPESDGYKYCLCMVDQLSHMLLIEPLKETSGDTILEVMKNRVFLKFGFPVRIIADRGLNVSGQFAYDFYQRFGVELVRTTSFHPQTNGMVESLKSSDRTLFSYILVITARMA